VQSRQSNFQEMLLTARLLESKARMKGSSRSSQLLMLHHGLLSVTLDQTVASQDTRSTLQQQLNSPQVTLTFMLVLMEPTTEEMD